MKRLMGLMFGSWVLSLACWMTAQAEDVAVPRLAVDSYQLDNGLRVALSHDPQAPNVTVCVTYHVGSKNERKGLTGFAHFFEHMMFRGTKNVPNYDLPLQAAGGSPNAFTSNDVTVYYESIPASYLERALYMEADRMAYLPSALDQQKFDTEREIVKNERRQRMENVPYGLASETIAASLFPKGHPYSWSVIGSMKDLNQSTLDDLKRFFYEFYHPGNATVTVVGNFDADKTKRWIEYYFGPIPTGLPVQDIKVPPTKPVNRRLTQFDQVQFPRVYWSWPTVAETHADAPALDLLATILTSGDASRLRQAMVIRKPLAVEVSAQSDTRELDGLMTIFATVAPGSSIAKCEEEMGKQIKRLQQGGPSDEELQRALAKHENGVLQMLTPITNRAFIIGMGYAQYNNPHFYQTYITEYVKVTPQDIQRVAKRYLTDAKLVLEVVPPQPGAEESPAVLAEPSESTEREVPVREMPEDPRYAVLPQPTEPPPLKIPTFERHRLSNGLNVWISKWNTLPLVVTQLVIPAGSAADSPAQAGLAALTARSWDKGTKQKTATEFAQSLDALGVSLSVGAGTETTQMGYTVGKVRLAQSLNLVGEMLSQPRFDAADVQRERSLMLSALARVRDNPNQIAARVFPRLLYGKTHPYGRPASGYESSVQSLSADTVRNYYDQYLKPDGATLVVVGDVEPEPLLRLLEEHWGAWQGKPKPIETAAKPQPEYDARVFLVDKPQSVQSVLVMGRTWRSRKDPDYFPAQVGNRVIGGDFVSRINRNLREQNGYTYGAYTGFRYQKNGGRWVLQTSVRSDVTGAALAESIRELAAAVGDRPLSDEEISIAKQAELNSLPESFETPSSIAGAMMQIAIYGLPADYLERQFRELRSVDSDRVRQVMAELLPPKRQTILIVGDRKAVEPQLKAAGIDGVELLDPEGSLPQSR